MRTMTGNDAGAARVSVAGRNFDLLKTDEEIMAQGFKALRGCLALNPNDEDGIRAHLQATADLLDSWLGKGTVVRLAGGRPVGVTWFLGIINDIIRQRNEWYSRYVAEQYGGKA